MGYFDAWECCDCNWLDPSDKKWGDMYCKKKSKYVDPNSSSCGSFSKNNSSSTPCYLTTAMCNILGHDDDCEILNNLRNFRDNFMKNTPECAPLLEDYDTVGPMIAKKLEEDEDRKFNANIMLYFYITPAIKCIKNEEYDDAIEIYKDMTLNLMHKYNIDRSLLASEKIQGANMVRKREMAKINA